MRTLPAANASAVWFLPPNDAGEAANEFDDSVEAGRQYGASRGIAVTGLRESALISLATVIPSGNCRSRTTGAGGKRTHGAT